MTGKRPHSAVNLLMAWMLLLGTAAPALSGQGQVDTGQPANEELAAFKAAIRAKYDLKEEAFRNNDVEPII
ncbi:MAG: hypothetical protein ACPGPG_00610, partial [Luminiphilus sp.]